MIDNIEILKTSLANEEPLIDDFYIKSWSLIISKDVNTQNKLMKDNSSLIELISTYNFALKNNDENLKLSVIEQIIKISDWNKSLNFSELFSFFSVVDISFSIYSKLNYSVKKIVVKRILEKYIEMRHNLYLSYWYSPTTLQVWKDAKAHKESGNLWLFKVWKILNDMWYVKSNDMNVLNFLQSKSKLYIETDKKWKRLFQEIVENLGLKFEWSSDKDEKMPDFLIKNWDDIFILEHKHIKEFWGWQFKQVNEIISLIWCSENNEKIHYVWFLDWIYFNYFIDVEIINDKTWKIRSQLKNIESNLKSCKSNYFLNTAWFLKLLDSIK